MNGPAAPQGWFASLEARVFDWITDTMLPFNQWMNSLPPSVWRGSAVGLFVLSALAALLISRSYIYRGAPDSAGWRDLRYWAVVALIPYMIIYAYL